MELLGLIGLLVLLAVASAVWGAESRPALASKEWEQAALGLTWRSQLATTPHLQVERGALATTRRVRRAARAHRVAAHLG